ncbi:hypothetical protein NDU88_000473 [Pleurodeles waltl]|uniref:Uncharacterized protein n=1 Tax=Pleurodeles waltl TaxID=8319 RepID=A0AAV7NHC1_PLEWA|nr:hypothetical protein NDU88_000473 [Pleurodeles waltl]
MTIPGLRGSPHRHRILPPLELLEPEVTSFTAGAASALADPEKEAAGLRVTEREKGLRREPQAAVTPRSLEAETGCGRRKRGGTEPRVWRVLG